MHWVPLVRECEYEVLDSLGKGLVRYVMSAGTYQRLIEAVKGVVSPCWAWEPFVQRIVNDRMVHARVV